YGGEPPSGIYRRCTKVRLIRSICHKVSLVLLRKDAPGQFSPTADMDFFKDRFEMILHGVRGHVKGGRYLRRGTSLQNQVGHLPFALREMIRLHDQRRDFYRTGDLEQHGQLTLFSPTREP